VAPNEGVRLRPRKPPDGRRGVQCSGDVPSTQAGGTAFDVAAKVLDGPRLQHAGAFNLDRFNAQSLQHLHDVLGDDVLLLALLKSPTALTAPQAGAGQRHGPHR